MEIKDIYEFLVWDNCNNNCKFCFQRNTPRIFNYKIRQYILNNVITFIDSDQFIKGSHILIVGGEIFYNLADQAILSTFFNQIIERMLNNIIDLLYINTNLLYSDCINLYNLLGLIKKNNLFDRLRFTTSYDIEGRFKEKEDEQLMLTNLLSIKEKYPKCQIVTNIILTKQLCNAILANTFSPKKFMTTYNCWINFIPYIVSCEELLANRDLIFKVLQKIENENPGYLAKYITNLDLNQEKKLYLYKDGKFQFCSCELAKCGHAINFKKYSKNGSCFICDLKRLFHG